MQGGAQTLDREYAAGYWDYLAGDRELPRFSVLAGYWQRYGRAGRLLEIGCGEGLLPERLGGGYEAYTGIDISTAAIGRAESRRLPRTRFVVADAESFEPEGHFDAIAFNEVLEYMSDPLGVVRRYEQWLQPEGAFLVSQFRSTDNARTRKIWKRLHRRYRVRASTVVSTGGLTWTLEVLAPRPDVISG